MGTGTWAQAHFDATIHNRTIRQAFVTATIGVLTALFAVCRLLTGCTPFKRCLPSFFKSPGITSSTLNDGSPISAWDAFRIVRCYNQHLLQWQWHQGTFAILDNHRLGHFRTP